MKTLHENLLAMNQVTSGGRHCLGSLQTEQACRKLFVVFCLSDARNMN